MTDPIGAVTFTGANTVLSATYTRSHGTRPDVALLELAPQATISSDFGTLVFTYAAVTLAFADCRVRHGSIRLNQSGQIVGMEIQDRRWRWRNCPITGHYNVVLADGSIDPATVKTNRELATLLFQAMGETVGTTAIVTALPNTTPVEVDWDVDDADSELEKLCAHLGCHVVLDVTDVAYLYPLGTGSPLTTTDSMTISVGVTSDGLPYQLEVVGPPVWVQSKLKLSAVGLDSDGTLQLIDDLSYTPSGGWEGEYADLMSHVTDINDRELARLSVFKWYLVTSQANGTQAVPGYGTISDIRQILPIYNTTVQLDDGLGDSLVSKQATVEGTFKLGGNPDPRRNSDDFTYLSTKFEMHGDIGLLKFEQPVIKQAGDGVSDNEDIAAADLYLVASYHVKNATNGQLERYTTTRVVGTVGAGTRTFRESALQQVFIGAYSGGDAVLTGTLDNTTTIDGYASDILDALQAEFATYQTGDVEYIGLKAFALTGVVRQITWTIAGKPTGTRTRVSFNGEHDRIIASHAERRRMADWSYHAIEGALHHRRRHRGQK